MSEKESREERGESSDLTPQPPSRDRKGGREEELRVEMERAMREKGVGEYTRWLAQWFDGAGADTGTVELGRVTEAIREWMKGGADE